MKTLHLFNHYLPQTENWAYNLIVNLPDTKVFIGAKHYLKYNFYHPAFTCYEHPFGEMEQQYRRWDKHRPVDFLKKVGFKAVQPFLGDMRAGLYRFAKEKEIDLVHAHFADVGWYFRSISKKLDVPFMVSFYGWDYSSLPNRFPIYKQRFKQLFSMADLFLCEGEYGAEKLVRMGCPSEKVKVQRLGVLSLEIPTFNRKKEKNQLQLLQVASFSEKKGHIYTVKAFEKALLQCPKLHLTLVGGETFSGIKSRIEKFILERDLQDNVTILDQLDYNELYAYLADFHVLIHPSCHAIDGDCEGGAPIILLDAQATGMPIISTTHCDIPSEVIHQKTGLLTPENDVDLLAESIRSFYEMDNEQFQSFSQAAVRHVSKEFNINSNARHLKAIYDLMV
ncbi:MAG: glycosyltransferase family 4 protein [Saprospiraceae bacterium]